ncbi:MAG TPA: hypothetical protein VMW40_08685 [Candidatus Bathyarchaeia archaeon]|nr:hypothetical protein [Candidatus Bathyarchaeia archaeon]
MVSSRSKTLSGFIFYRVLDYSHAGTRRNKIDLKLDCLADLATFIKVQVEEKATREQIEKLQQEIAEQRTEYQYKVDGDEYGITVRNDFDVSCTELLEKLFQIIYDEGLLDARFMQTVDWASISLGGEKDD